METTPFSGGTVVSGDVPLEQRPRGWRGFLNSWQVGAILAAALVLGVIAIVTANPFARVGQVEVRALLHEAPPEE